MKVMKELDEQTAGIDQPEEADALLPLVRGRRAVGLGTAADVPPVVVGELIALTDDGRTPLVAFPSQPGTAATPARSIVDLHGAHIGSAVVLAFDAGDITRPIVMGVVRSGRETSLDAPAVVDLDADGERLLVSAREQLVLRCGKASITLTRAGKVLLQGEYVSARSNGVIRIKGGSVQLN